MTDWQRLPDRTTPEGDILRTEVAVIGEEVWYHGTIPKTVSVPHPGALRRLIIRLLRLGGHVPQPLK